MPTVGISRCPRSLAAGAINVAGSTEHSLAAKRILSVPNGGLLPNSTSDTYVFEYPRTDASSRIVFFALLRALLKAGPNWLGMPGSLQITLHFVKSAYPRIRGINTNDWKDC